METLKLFVAQPLLGKSYETAKEICESVKRKIKTRIYPNVEIEFVGYPDPNVVGTEAGNKHRKDDALKCLSETIQNMAEADIVYFVEDYSTSRTCRCAFEIALRYPIKSVIRESKDNRLIITETEVLDEDRERVNTSILINDL